MVVYRHKSVEAMFTLRDMSGFMESSVERPTKPNMLSNTNGEGNFPAVF